MGLDEISVIIFDCQATHANPKRGNLLEMAWEITPGIDAGLPNNSSFNHGVNKSYLIKLPNDETIPKHVERVTGITADDLNSGTSIKNAWKDLVYTFKEIETDYHQSNPVMIIHYARYEEAYLKYLHQRFDPDIPFPFKIICTHKISKYLWPELPRCGLRAVAGFLDYPLGKMRRSVHHVEATTWIWKKIVEQLEDQEGVNTIGDLDKWLDSEKPSRVQKQYPMSREKLNSIPDRPGIYRMLRSNGNLLYIGKATSLRQRVNSYFQKSSNHAEHILEMLTQAKDISITETKTALEAALLESDEIKKNSPQYNIALRKGSRKICFSDIHFKKVSNQYTRKFKTGPFPSEEIPLSLRSILRLMDIKGQKQIEHDLMIQSLMVSEAFIPDQECFYEGIKIYQKEIEGLKFGTFKATTLIKLGTDLWQERLNRIEVEKTQGDIDENEDKVDKEDPEEWQWTPERVAHRFYGVVCYGVHMVRRGEWMRKLSESALSWDIKNTTHRDKHTIIMRNAQLVHHKKTYGKIIKTTRTKYKLSTIQRMNQFNISDYDRLRILTTEIRRLLKENRNPELRLSPNSVLKSEELTKELKWV